MASKQIRKLTSILLYAGNSLLVPLTGLVLSVLVVRLASPALWGAYTQVVVIVQLGLHFLSWGNKEFLIREISRQPATEEKVWISVLGTRALLLPLVLAGILFVPLELNIRLIACGWIILKFIYNSFEPRIILHRYFRTTLVAEACGFLLLTAVTLYYNAQMTPVLLLAVSALSEMVKIIIVATKLRMRKMSGFTIQQNYFRASLPFFLLGLSGLLASRLDLYLVSIYMDKTAIASYAVFIGLLAYIQSGSNFILIPYVKSLYRLPAGTIRKISRKLFLAGLGLCVAGLGVVYFITTVVYRLHFSYGFYAAGLCATLPVYAYLPGIYYLYKLRQEKLVLSANVMAMCLNGFLSFVLIRVIGSQGALLALAISQLSLLAFYVSALNRIRT